MTAADIDGDFTAVDTAMLPVLILGMATALTHLIRADACTACISPRAADRPEDPASRISPERLAEAQAAATQLVDAGQRVSRRHLHAAGLHGSNADLNALARILADQICAQEDEDSCP
jgi:hypothetical protein